MRRRADVGECLTTIFYDYDGLLSFKCRLVAKRDFFVLAGLRCPFIRSEQIELIAVVIDNHRGPGPAIASHNSVHTPAGSGALVQTDLDSRSTGAATGLDDHIDIALRIRSHSDMVICMHATSKHTQLARFICP